MASADTAPSALVSPGMFGDEDKTVFGQKMSSETYTILVIVVVIIVIYLAYVYLMPMMTTTTSSTQSNLSQGITSANNYNTTEYNTGWSSDGLGGTVPYAGASAADTSADYSLLATDQSSVQSNYTPRRKSSYGSAKNMLNIARYS